MGVIGARARRSRIRLLHGRRDRLSECDIIVRENINIESKDDEEDPNRIGVYSAEAHLRRTDQRKIHSPQDRPRGLSHRRLCIRDRP